MQQFRYLGLQFAGWHGRLLIVTQQATLHKTQCFGILQLLPLATKPFLLVQNTACI